MSDEFLMRPDVQQQLQLLVVVVIVPAIVAAFRKWVWPCMPKQAKPFFAVGLGIVLELCIKFLEGSQATGAIALLVGLAAIGVRELAMQVKAMFQTDEKAGPSGSAQVPPEEPPS